MFPWMMKIIILLLTVSCHGEKREDLSSPPPPLSPYSYRHYKFIPFTEELGIEGLRKTCEETSGGYFDESHLKCNCPEGQTFILQEGGMCAENNRLYTLLPECETNQDEKCFKFSSNIGYTEIDLLTENREETREFLNLYKTKEGRERILKILTSFPVLEKPNIRFSYHWGKANENKIKHGSSSLTFFDIFFVTNEIVNLHFFAEENHAQHEMSDDLLWAKDVFVSFPLEQSVGLWTASGDCRMTCLYQLKNKERKMELTVRFIHGVIIERLLKKTNHLNTDMEWHFFDEKASLKWSLFSKVNLQGRKIIGENQFTLKGRGESFLLKRFEKDINKDFSSFDKYQKRERKKKNVVLVCDHFNYGDLLLFENQSSLSFINNWSDKQKTSLLTASCMGRIGLCLQTNNHGNDVIRAFREFDTESIIIPVPLDFCLSEEGGIHNLINDENVKVANFSFFQSYRQKMCEQTPLYKIIKDNPQTLFVMGAGNEGKENPVLRCPQNLELENKIIVGGYEGNYRWSLSDYGRDYVDVFADVDVKGRKGTSFASPRIAGVASWLSRRYLFDSGFSLKMFLLDLMETSYAGEKYLNREEFVRQWR